MTYKRWFGILSITLWGAAWMTPTALYANAGVYTIEDLKLSSAGDLVAVCTLAPEHEHYASGVAFCFGFFEGIIRYAEAISGSKDHKKLVCPPAGTTRLEAVEVFTRYLEANPQYAQEGPVDAVYRALIPRWPCP